MTDFQTLVKIIKSKTYYLTIDHYWMTEPEVEIVFDEPSKKVRFYKRTKINDTKIDYTYTPISECINELPIDIQDIVVRYIKFFM